MLGVEWDLNRLRLSAEKAKVFLQEGANVFDPGWPVA